MYKPLIMEQKNKNEKPFSNGKTLIKIVVMVLVVLIFRNNPEVLDYILIFLESILDLILNSVSKKSNDSKTN